MVREKCVLELKVDLDYEWEFLGKLLSVGEKCYQTWMYRRFLVECSGCYEHEKEFCDTYIQSDNKNIHSWTYRKWIVDTFGLFDGELEYTESKYISSISLLEYIKIDIFNNSAWSYRFYVYSHLHVLSILAS